MNCRKLWPVAAVLTLSFSSPSEAGTDIQGLVQRLQLAPDGTLWFSMDTTPAASYCRAGWAGLTMYVPTGSALYPYYYGILLSAVSKGKNIYLGNISAFNGSLPCDITQTGYGIMLVQ